MNLVDKLSNLGTAEKIEIMCHELEGRYGGHIKGGRFSQDYIEFDYMDRYPTGIVEDGHNSGFDVSGKYKTVTFKLRK